jgi:hypothetical protein
MLKTQETEQGSLYLSEFRPSKNKFKRLTNTYVSLNEKKKGGAEGGR